jgi:hypothetical protein
MSGLDWGGYLNQYPAYFFAPNRNFGQRENDKVTSAISTETQCR